MEKLINFLNQKDLAQVTKHLENNNDIFASTPTNNRAHLLSTLDYNTHSVVIIGLLNEIAPSAELLVVFNRLLREFDYEHVKLQTKQFLSVCKKYTAYFLANSLGIKVLKSLQIALERIREHDTGFNPLFLLFIKHCLKTRVYNLALPLLEKAVTSINKNFAGDLEDDLTNYFYFGGHILMALKKYESAYIYFRFCFQFSHGGISSALLNARRKLIILLLRNPKLQYLTGPKKFEIDHGQLARHIEFAKNLDAEENEGLNIVTRLYTDLLNNTELQDREKLLGYLRDNAEVFQEDQTWGLAKELVASFDLRKLKQLKKVYQTLSFDEVAKDLNIQENLVPTLLKAFSVKPIGRIDLKNKAVTFVRAEDPYKLESLNQIYSLTKNLKEVSDEYNKEHEMIIRDRISMPNTIFS